MKLLGMIGGTGPESTIDYYRLLIAAYQKLKRVEHYPPVLINSIDGTRVLALLTANDMKGVAALLLEEIGRLAQAGVTMGLLTSNTLHIVFDDLQRASDITLISSVETTCQVAKAQHLQRVGLIGTRHTMQHGFYQRVFAREGLEIVVPNRSEQEFIHACYFSELVRGVFRAETRARVIVIAQRLKQEEGIEALVLGGTELPLLLRGAGNIDVPLLDTARLHVERAVRELY